MLSQLQIHDKNILIVDDNATNILLIQAILEGKGFNNIYSASSALEAYELLEHEKINLILMDVMMPEIDGLEATDAIKSNAKYAHIPIIMVTATDDDDILKKSFEFGASDFIKKPVNQVELIARVTTILQSQLKDDFILQHSRFDAMEEIIGMLAHQWRQPLSVISTIVNTIQVQKALSTLNDEELDKSLESISHHAKALSEMISRFRAFFKTDTAASLASPNDAIYEATELMKEDLQHHQINLELKLEEIRPVFYIQNLLVQVLTNLITNSREATERNHIKDAQIIIGSSCQGDKIAISVEDNAGGIDQNIIEHIFEPYYSTKIEKNGKGLGLYLAKSLLTQQLQGEISVVSHDSRTKFLITFRASEDDKEQTS